MHTFSFLNNKNTEKTPPKTLYLDLILYNETAAHTHSVFLAVSNSTATNSMEPITAEAYSVKRVDVLGKITFSHAHFKYLQS